MAKNIRVQNTIDQRFFAKREFVKMKIIENTFVDYTGRVYNIEVEEDNSYSLPNCDSP